MREKDKPLRAADAKSREGGGGRKENRDRTENKTGIRVNE
jgi:hypothetical protein